jgi:hypothetical protein
MRTAVLSLGVLGCATAVAAKPVAVVAVGGCSDGQAATHARAIRDALAAKWPGQVQSEPETAGALGGLARGAPADVERMVLAARHDFFQEAYARAEQSLTRAEHDALSLPPSASRGAALRDLRLLQVMTLLKRERPDEARALAMSVLALEPDLKPDAKAYPPSLRAFLDSVRPSVKAKPRHAVTLTTEPSGVAVYVNGTPVGATPVTVSLPAALYRLEASFHEGRAVPKWLPLSEATSVELNETFEGALNADAGPCLEGGSDRALRLLALARLGAMVGAQWMVSAWEETTPGGERYLAASTLDVRTGQETHEARVRKPLGATPAEAPSQLAEFLATGRARGEVEAVRTPPPTVAEKREATRRDRLRTYAYVNAGAAVVSLGLSGFFHLQGNTANAQIVSLRGADGSVSPANASSYSAQRAKLSSSRTATWVFAGAAVVTAGAAATLYWLGALPPTQPTERGLAFTF